MPLSSWVEWFIAGATAVGVALAAAGIAFMEALAPWRPYLLVGGALFFFLGLVFLAVAASQARYAPVLVRWREKRRRRLDDARLGFQIAERSLLVEGDLRGERVRLRPKGTMMEALLLVEFDAPLAVVRWRLEGRPGGRYRELRVDLAEHSITDHAARALEIPISGPPSLDRDTDLIIELLGLGAVRATRIVRP